MIDTIIFDFGDIFINLDKQATPKAFEKLGLQQWNSTLDALNVAFETGKISRHEFLDGLQKQIPQANKTEILKAWNSILLDFPQYRLDFLVLLSKKYRLFLLSNTDAIHIEQFEKQSGAAFCSTFYKCFEKVYFSFDLGMRKPDLEIYKHLLDSNHLIPTNTLFVDDKKENTDAALKTGLQVWNLQVGTEDVVDLFEKINL